MELIKKRAQKVLQQKKSKQESAKIKSALIHSSSTTPNDNSTIENSNNNSKLNSYVQEIDKSNLSKFEQLPQQTFIPNSFTIKNLDKNQYQAKDQQQFSIIQQNLNSRYERIHSNQLIQLDLWTSYKTNLQKAEAQFFGACASANLALINQILQGKSQYPIDINCIQEEGRNSLHVTLNTSQNQDILRRLLNAGVDINHKSKLGRTPLVYATIKGLLKIVKLLIEFKCDLNIQDKYGNTALHYSYITQMLLQNKTDITLANNQNQKAYQISSNIKIIELFQTIASTTFPSDYNRKAHEEMILKNSRATHVQKFLSLNNNIIKPLQKKQSDEMQGQTQNPRLSLSRRKQKFKRYQVMSQIIIKDIKQVSLLDFIQVDVLGKGAFGSVLLVQQQSTKNLYAMKILNKNQILQQRLLRYALTQRKILSTINHPFIVKLHYAFQTVEKLILVMDYCPGGDLLELVRKKKVLQESLVKKYVAQIILALECLHKAQIIYRDLKPANIVIDTQGHACITDFGLAKQAQVSHSFCGSLAYLSPQMLSRRGHTRTLDWYLLGVLIYECITGRPPFWDTNKEQLLQNIKIGRYKPLPGSVSNQLKDLIAQLLKSNPSKRLGSQQDSEQLKKHTWFKQVDWRLVQERKQVMPINASKYKNKNNLRVQLFSQKDVQLSKNINHIKQWQFKE